MWHLTEQSRSDGRKPQRAGRFGIGRAANVLVVGLRVKILDVFGVKYTNLMFRWRGAAGDSGGVSRDSIPLEASGGQLVRVRVIDRFHSPSRRDF